MPVTYQETTEHDAVVTEVGWTGTTLRVAGSLHPAPDGAPEARLVLREHDGDRTLSCPATAAPAGSGGLRFEAAIDVAGAADGRPLPHGLWDLDLTVGAETVPLGPGRSPGLDVSPRRGFLPDSTTVTVYFSVYGPLAVDVGGERHVAGDVRADAVAWNEHDETLVVSGHLDLRAFAPPISATLALRDRRTGRVYEVIAMLDAGADRMTYTADIPMTRAFVDDPLPRGTWDATLVVGFSGLHRELCVLAPAEPVDHRVRRRLRHLRITSTRAPAPLTITVGGQ
ncbi:hypothetical protein [Actinomadura miaoliensis]|uniref:Urease accessory protein UreD n=1 Tax=Actinomadura miaoliensis TaxID=430685 RepID=A0ABP7VQT9_9ACTN